MPSKGISVYSYISVSGYEVEFSVPNSTVRNTKDDNFTSKDLEVESSNLEGGKISSNYVGEFDWKVYDPNGQVIGSKWNNINSVTGMLVEGTMTSTADFSPIVTDSVIITYGFYDAGHGESWMGTIVPPGSSREQLSFAHFALAAPHDNGMNSMQSANAILSAVDVGLVDELRKIVPGLHFFEHIPDEFLVKLLPDIVYGVSITQKKQIPIMLALGARYFEFRPAELFQAFEKSSKLPNKFYFTHAVIPGLAFDEFLEQQVTFLDSHPTEIVVIHIRYDNIIKECKRPSEDQVQQLLNEACAKAQQSSLSWGGRECFSTSIAKLRSSGKRLIVVTEADKYDSWTASAYATLKADPILARFESMNTEGQASTDITVLQCQATSQSIKEVLLYSIMNANASNSCLTSTKGMLDMKTLPWIRANALQNLQAERLLVIMNDFIDGATCDTSIELSRQRLQEKELQP